MLKNIFPQSSSNLVASQALHFLNIFGNSFWNFSDFLAILFPRLPQLICLLSNIHKEIIYCGRIGGQKCQKICWKYVGNMSENVGNMSENMLENMSEICWKTCQKYVGNVSEMSENMSEMSEICRKYVRNMSEICQKIRRKICWKHVRNMSENMSEICHGKITCPPLPSTPGPRTMGSAGWQCWGIEYF
jgi:hypothetical protein